VEFAMKLQTANYLPESSAEMADPMIGLPDLRKGLNTILLGYLVSLVASLIMGGLIAYLVVQNMDKRMSMKTVDELSTLLFGAVLVFGLAMIGSVILIVRGKWLCLSSAPEQCHAKWMMFLSILCILTGPTLNFATHFINDPDPGPKRGGGAIAGQRFLKEIEKFKDGIPPLDAKAYVRLAGQGIGMLSTIFFVLFLRALAKCWGADWRAAFIELYLLFVAILVAGVVVLFWKPAFMLARPPLLLSLGGGWLLAGVWYFALIVSTSLGISYILATKSGKKSDIDTLEEPPRKSSLDFIG
jgi:hypothetical protein